MRFIFRLLFFFKQKTAYEMRISDWSSDVWLFRSLLALPPPLIVRPAAEEAAEEGIVEQRGNRALLDLALGEDVDHRRRRLLDHRREGQHDLLKIGRASCRERVCQYV